MWANVIPRPERDVALLLRRRSHITHTVFSTFFHPSFFSPWRSLRKTTWYERWSYPEKRSTVGCDQSWIVVHSLSYPKQLYCKTYPTESKSTLQLLRTIRVVLGWSYEMCLKMAAVLVKDGVEVLTPWNIQHRLPRVCQRIILDLKMCGHWLSLGNPAIEGKLLLALCDRHWILLCVHGSGLIITWESMIFPGNNHNFPINTIFQTKIPKSSVSMINGQSR